jgi:tryptophan aminotransferase
MTSLFSKVRVKLVFRNRMTFTGFADDPYYYLYYGPEPRPASYFKLEHEVLSAAGRVVRFDSFSKVLSAGLRIGFASGPKPIIDAIDKNVCTYCPFLILSLTVALQTACSNLQPPGMTQVMAYTLLKHWGYEGFAKHTAVVADFYRAKRDVFVGAMEKHLTGLAEWIVPEAGMFLWFELLLPAHSPHAQDSEALIREEAFANGVLALPGTVFMPNGPKTPYVRASFSLLEPAKVDEALRRLAVTVKQARENS